MALPIVEGDSQCPIKDREYRVGVRIVEKHKLLMVLVLPLVAIHWTKVGGNTKQKPETD